jgi:hypothetical protein
MASRGPMFGGMGGLGSGGGADPAPVTPPAATSEAVAADGAPSAKTFSAFTDPDGRISSYSAAITNAVGSTAIATGSGLGAYTVSGYGNGNSYAIRLTALDADGDPLATAVHVVDIAATSYSALTPAAAPADQRLTAGTTSSSTITWGTPTGGSGSVSLAVTLDTVHASGTPALSGSGSSRTVTGLSDGDVVLARGVWTDATTGETVEQAVAVSVAPAASGSLGWVTLSDYDLTSVDTASGVTTTTGDIALTVGSAAFVSLVDRTGSGTGTITPTNGTGVVVDTVGAGSRSMAITHDWAGDGIDPTLTPVVVEAEYDITTTGTGSNLIAGMASQGSSALTGNVNFCLRMDDAGANIELAPRVYKSAATNDSVGVASASITTVSVSVMMLPQGFEIGYSLGALPADPRNHTYRRAYAWSQAFTSAPSDFSMTDAPRLIFHAFNSAGTYAWTRARFRALGVV